MTDQENQDVRVVRRNPHRQARNNPIVPVAAPRNVAAPRHEAVPAAAPRNVAAPRNEAVSAAAPRNVAAPRNEAVSAAAPRNVAAPRHEAVPAAAPRNVAAPRHEAVLAAAPRNVAAPRNEAVIPPSPSRRNPAALVLPGPNLPGNVAAVPGQNPPDPVRLADVRSPNGGRVTIFKHGTITLPSEVDYAEVVCSVCHRTGDSFRQHKLPMAVTSCHHRFCVGCIYKWKKTSRTCPMCQQLLTRRLTVKHIV